MSQLTLDPVPRKLPLKKTPERKLTPGSVSWKIWNYIRTSYTPRTEAQIKDKFPEHTIGNRLRDLRRWGYITDKKTLNGPQVWRAIY